MKKIITLILFFLSQVSFAQNLVPNPSFEDTVACPDNIGQVDKSLGWSEVRPTPDYYNICATAGGFNNVGVPSNAVGYQYPASGNAYCGFGARGGVSSNHECIGAHLISSLQIGTKYYVSFKVSLFDLVFTYRCAVNKLGALFSTQIYSTSNPAPICNCSQVYTDSIITDSLNWFRIKGSFTAADNYSFISIGNFFEDSLTDSIQITGPYCVSYYYIDDVCVSTDSSYCYNYSYTGINHLNNETIIKYYPNPCLNDLTVEDKMNSIAEIKIYNTSGQLLKVNDMKISTGYLLNLSDLPQGIYNLMVISKKSELTNHILIKL